MGIFDKFYGFLVKYVFSNAKLILVMFILLMLYRIDIISKRNEELNHKLEVVNTELKGKEDQINCLKKKQRLKINSLPFTNNLFSIIKQKSQK